MTIQKARRLRSKSGVGNDSDDVVEVGFVEPVLNDSTIITGQKLEDPPTAKIMKELGAFHKNNPVNMHYNENIEEYNKSLQSQKLIENNTDFSNIRYHSEKSNNGEETPDFTSNNVKNGISKPKSRKKTILNRLKKSYQELVDNSSPISSASTPNEDVDNEFDQLNSGSSSSLDPTSLNQDFCSCCGMVGMFLCCESCPKSYHFQCINPPIDSNDLPDSWYCKDCIKKKTLKNKREIPVVNVGIYSKLFDNIQFQDSISFQLPTEIIDSFQGISIDKFGDYKDDSVKPEKSYKQLIKESEDPFHGIYKPSNGSNTISDPEPYFCYHCGLSGLNNRELINCDYCPLSWHLDCLDPPLTSIKQIGSKWKCPNHIDDLDTPVRKFKSQEIVEIASLNNFEKLEGKLPINAQVEIVSIEEKLRNLKEQAKQMNMGISKSNLKFNNLIFKVNEEDIILNFINSTKIKEVSSNNENVHNLMNLKPNLKDYVLSLSKLSKKSVISNEMRKVNLQELLKITNDELKEETADFTVDETKEYKLIRKLITLKGKDKLLEFLNS